MSTESNANAIDHYDYIIVGAGSAGCVLANRLSAHPNDKVLLIEAGGETHPLSRVPISYGYFINKPGVNWRYFCEPEAATAQRSISPQLLELSGIGQRDVIAAHGIEVRHERPGVGENLRDHLAPRLVNSINGKGVTYNDRMQGAWQGVSGVSLPV